MTLRCDDPIRLSPVATVSGGARYTWTVAKDREWVHQRPETQWTGTALGSKGWPEGAGDMGIARGIGCRRFGSGRAGQSVNRDQLHPLLPGIAPGQGWDIGTDGNKEAKKRSETNRQTHRHRDRRKGSWCAFRHNAMAIIVTSNYVS